MGARRLATPVASAVAGTFLAGMAGLAGATAATAATAATTATAAAHDAGRAGGKVTAVSDPPAVVAKHLSLRIHGSASAVAVYASPAPRKVKRAVRLAGSATVRRGKVSVAVPRKLKPGAYYIVACPAKGAGRCASSTRAMLKAPTKLSAPVQAHPVADTAHAATATIGSGGGKLTATAANGTVFELAIAAGSVPDGTQITMTPLSTVGGTGWAGRFVGGVQLGPEGLTLLHGGTLTIVPTHRIPVADQVAFGYTGTGADLVQAPLAPTRSAIEIPLAHFSGAGLGDSPSGAGAAAPPSSGGDDADFYGQLIAEAMAAARAGQISEDEAFDEARSWLGDMYSDVMRDEVGPGLNDDTAAAQAIKDLLAYARDEALLGDQSESAFEAVKPTILKLIQGVWNRAQQRCANNHDLTAIAQILDADRNEQLLGYPGYTIPQDLQCLTFRIDFESLVEVHAGSGGSGEWDLDYQAHPTVTPDADSGYQFLSGSTAGTYATADGTITGDDGTTVTVTGAAPDTFAVDKFTIPTTAGDTSAPTLLFSLGKPSETYSYDDPGGDSGTYVDNQWLDIFNDFHPPQYGYTSLTLQLVGGGGALIARGTFDNAAPDGSGTEATTVDVYHTPPPPPH